jgi:hypothetical protein
LPSSDWRTVLIAIGRRLHCGHMTSGTLTSGLSSWPIAESRCLIAGTLIIVSSSDIRPSPYAPTTSKTTYKLLYYLVFLLI